MTDLTRLDAVKSIVENICATFGRLDICVNNARLTVLTEEEQFSEGIDTLSLDNWHKLIERNLTTCFLVTQAVLPLMRVQKYGRIINISSTSEPVQAFVGDSAYHAAKA